MDIVVDGTLLHMCGNAVFLSMSSKVSPLNPKNTKRTINEERKVFADKWLAHLERRFHPMKGNESALTCFICESKVTMLRKAF